MFFGRKRPPPLGPRGHLPVERCDAGHLKAAGKCPGRPEELHPRRTSGVVRHPSRDKASRRQVVVWDGLGMFGIGCVQADACDAYQSMPRHLILLRKPPLCLRSGFPNPLDGNGSCWSTWWSLILLAQVVKKRVDRRNTS